MADKEGMERKVYLLPAELVGRIKAYQEDHRIPSEVEAARRLLDTALQMRDTVESLLRQLRDRFKEERDVRILARDVLANHSLIRTVIYQDDGAVEFRVATGEWGRLQRDGLTYTGDGHDDHWALYPPKPRQPPSWDAGKGAGDLDEEIPF